MDGRTHVVGDAEGERTVADAYLFALSRWAAMIGADLDEWPNTARFGRSMREDDGVRNALDQEEPE